MKNVIPFLIAFLFIACQFDSEDESNQSEDVQTDSVTDLNIEVEDTSGIGMYSVVTFEHENGGWGYQIMENQKLYINQPHIPAVSGVKTFINQEEAEITANFVVYKLTNNIFPPSLSKVELDSLEITY